MTTSVAEIMRKLLLGLAVIHDSTIRGTGKWPSFIATIPNEPDNLVVVSDTTSAKDGRLMMGEVIEHHGVQFTVRSNSYPTGYHKAKEIEEVMDSIHNITVVLGTGTAAVSYLINAVRRNASVASLGVDPSSDQRREFFSLNVFVTVNPT